MKNLNHKAFVRLVFHTIAPGANRHFHFVQFVIFWVCNATAGFLHLDELLFRYSCARLSTHILGLSPAHVSRASYLLVLHHRLRPLPAALIIGPLEWFVETAACCLSNAVHVITFRRPPRCSPSSPFIWDRILVFGTGLYRSGARIFCVCPCFWPAFWHRVLRAMNA